MNDAYDDKKDDNSDLDYLDDMQEFVGAHEPQNKIKTGEEINLTLKDPTLNEILIGVGWDLKKFDAKPLDLDVSMFLLNAADKTRVDEDFVFYNNMIGCDGSVKHMGDSRTGAGDGDDEVMMINLNELPFDVSKVAFVLSIYDMDFNEHNFSMVKNVYFRIENKNTDHELFRYELDDELTGDEGLMIGYLERVGAEWMFQAVGETVKGGLGKIADEYGIIVMENMK
jgi:tellurium resistance protein TerD